jgi:plastocyanin
MEGQSATPPVARNQKNRQRLYAATAAFAFAVLVVGIYQLTTSHTKNTPRVATVHITATGFQPATLAVTPGTKIIWTNDDSVMHQVASNPFPQDSILPGLKSQILNNDQTYTYVAATSGTFDYHDQLKPTINGTLVVKKQ